MEDKLRKIIEQMTGRKMNLSRDFIALSQMIEEKTGRRISASTLRRFWGYINDGVTPSRFTKNLLAQFVGYDDFDHFATLSDNASEIQSLLVTGEKIDCDKLNTGQLLRLSWLPDRICTVRHDGGGRFTVMDSRNTRLAKGDTFECHLFINHETAYLCNWIHGDGLPLTYAVGKKNGIQVERYSTSYEEEDEF